MEQTVNLEKLKRGDPQAFKAFFERLYPKLMGLACRFVDQQTAEDLVQEVFAVYWEQRAVVDVKNIQSYMYTCVRNSCFNYLKHQSVVEAYESQIKIAEARMAFLSNLTEENDVLEQVITDDITKHIKDCVRKLPPKCAEAFELCYFKELSHKEIAERMQISHRTVEGHVRQAVSVLRKHLRNILSLF